MRLEIYVPSVTFRPYREMYPDGRAALLEDELVEVQLLTIRDAVDIHRTARQMIRVPRPAAELIRIWRSIATIDHDGALL